MTISGSAQSLDCISEVPIGIEGRSPVSAVWSRFEGKADVALEGRNDADDPSLTWARQGFCIAHRSSKCVKRLPSDGDFGLIPYSRKDMAFADRLDAALTRCELRMRRHRKGGLRCPTA